MEEMKNYSEGDTVHMDSDSLRFCKLGSRDRERKKQQKDLLFQGIYVTTIVMIKCKFVLSFRFLFPFSLSVLNFVWTTTRETVSSSSFHPFFCQFSHEEEIASR